MSYLKLLAVLLFVTLSGCITTHRDLRIKVVDEISRKPLANVEAPVQYSTPSVCVNPIPVYFWHDQFETPQTTNQDGIIEFKKFPSSRRIRFDKTGYQSASITRTFPWVSITRWENGEEITFDKEIFADTIIVPLRRVEDVASESDLKLPSMMTQTWKEHRLDLIEGGLLEEGSSDDPVIVAETQHDSKAKQLYVPASLQGNTSPHHSHLPQHAQFLDQHTLQVNPKPTF